MQAVALCGVPAGVIADDTTAPLCSIKTRLAGGAARALIFNILGTGNVLAPLWQALTSGALTLRMPSVGQIANAAAGSVGPILTMTGQRRHAATVQGIPALGQVGRSAAPIPRFGMDAATVATTIALIKWHIVLCKNLNIAPSLLARR